MSVGLDRRLANLRASASDRTAPSGSAAQAPGRADGGAGARRLASVLGGEIVERAGGSCVLIRRSPIDLGIDRTLLATLPGHPPPDAPLVCLDTETTGLATAAGTIAFLVGLGWWDGPRFHQAQLLLPDHADEAAVLAVLEEHIPRDAWLVTYNGRGFDWPLLVTRYRMHGRHAPDHAGHLDLLPFVRRVFRHRLPDARLRSVERYLLDVVRHGDVEGWEIPARYFDVLRGGPPALLADVIQHNHVDVRSLGQLVVRTAADLGDRQARGAAIAGDLAGLARAYRLAGDLDEALACLDLALAAPADRAAPTAVRVPVDDDPEAWHRPASLPWNSGHGTRRRPSDTAVPWTEQRLLVERAHLLRRLGRYEDAAETWAAVAASPGRLGASAWVEVAKLRERRLGDLAGALGAVDRALAALERRRRLGLPEPHLERLALGRQGRLRRRMDRWDRGERLAAGIG